MNITEDRIIKIFKFKLGENLNYLISNIIKILNKNNEIEIIILQKKHTLQDELDYILEVKK